MDLFRVQNDRSLHRATYGYGNDLPMARAELSELPIASRRLGPPLKANSDRIERELEFVEGTAKTIARSFHKGFLQGPQSSEQQTAAVERRLPHQLYLRRREVTLAKRHHFRLACTLAIDSEFVE